MSLSRPSPPPPHPVLPLEPPSAFPTVIGIPDPTTTCTPVAQDASPLPDTGPQWYWSQWNLRLCSVDCRCRSPPLLTLTLSSPPPAGVASISHQPPSVVAIPSSCGTPCIAIHPNHSQCVVSSPTSLTHTEELPGPPSLRSLPRSGCPRPLSPTPWPVAHTSLTPSVGWSLPPDSCCPTPTKLSQGT